MESEMTGQPTGIIKNNALELANLSLHYISFQNKPYNKVQQKVPAYQLALRRFEDIHLHHKMVHIFLSTSRYL